MSRICLVVAALISLTALASAEGIKGDVYYLGIALDQEGAAGSWAQVGAAGDWKDTAAGTILNDKLYSAEHAGGLYVTDLANGTWRQIGGNDFGATRFMLSYNGALYTIEDSGNLFHVDPETGGWQQLGNAGDWKQTLAAAVTNEGMYTAESGGGLFRTDLSNGHWVKIGGSDFGDTRFMFASGNTLYTIEKNGNLFRVNPVDGSWRQIGPAGAWATTVGGTILGGRLYTAQQDGHLFCTDLHNGSRQNVGNADFAATRFMFPVGAELFTIESTGNLYRVEPKAGQTIEAFDCFAEEVERIFHDQGKGLSHGLKVKKVEGAKATLRAITDGFHWLDQAGPDDLAVIYLTAHGGTDPKTGWSIATADLQTLHAAQIKQSLAGVHANVLFFLETCTCGGFAAEHEGDPAVPANVTVLCACKANETTDNPLDIAIGEALYGRADFNHDGVVDVDELIEYVQRRYKEMWPAPIQGSNTPVIVRSRRLSGSLALTHVSSALSAVAINNELWSSIDLGAHGDQFSLHLLGWPGAPGKPYYIADSTTRAQLCLPGDGPPLLVNDAGHWRPARRVQAEGSKVTIVFLDEPHTQLLTTPDRVRYAFVGGAK